MSQITLNKPNLTLRLRMWRALEKGGWYTNRILADELGIRLRLVDADYLKHLTTNGYLERATTSDRAHKWRVVKASSDAPRFDSRGNEIRHCNRAESVWLALRILKEGTFEQLDAHAEYSPSAFTKNYLSGLVAAGYVTLSAKRYRLARNTGPLPPQVLQVREVFDPNIDEIVYREVPDVEY